MKRTCWHSSLAQFRRAVALINPESKCLTSDFEERRRQAIRSKSPWHRKLHLAVEPMEPRLFLAADPIISEFTAVNDNSLLDADGDSSDWIEIHNPGDELVDIGGWYLTDDAESLNKWPFPDVTIDSQGYLVVFASDKDRSAAGEELHTNFRLSGNGEFLALVKPDGVTVSSQFGSEFPQQFEDISYGLQPTEEVTSLVSRVDAATFLVPDEATDARIGSTWSGGSEPFDDSAAAGWTPGLVGIGFDADVDGQRIDGTIAYQVPAATSGTQAFGGRLGMDFVVNRPITITSLGAFDDEGDGFFANVTVELWSRDDHGTSRDPHDDIGGEVLASQRFTARSPGIAMDGSRFKPMRERIVLQPGAYTIAAYGYNELERNGNSGSAGPFSEFADTSAIAFVGGSRFGSAGPDVFPGFADTGPANRYAAGTFTFIDDEQPDPSPEAGNSASIAYATRPGDGNATFDGNLGMDFDVFKPIRVTDLGVFDSGQDGISGTLGVSIWSRLGRNGAKIVSQTFIGDDGVVEPGTGSRFATLDEPVVLEPGPYSIVASGFLGDDLFSRFGFANSLIGRTDSGGGAISFVGSSRTSFAEGIDRFLELPHHRLPERTDSGPVNRFAAGTFKFETAIDELFGMNVEPQLSGVSSSIYVRTGFDVGDPSRFNGLRLNVNFNDGFVAYLNGREVARRNAPESVSWNSSAREPRTDMSALEAESIDISEHLDVLLPGSRNILAIHGLSAGRADRNFVVLPQLEGVTSTGRDERYFDEPTPGEPNAAGLVGFVDDTKFSRDRGYVETDDLDEEGHLQIEITTATQDAEIYYTLDGTEPAPTHGTLYTQPVALATTTTLRAAAFKDGFLPTNVDTQTFLFLDDVLRQSEAPAGIAAHWNGVAADYAMSQNPDDLPSIAGDALLTEPQYNQAIKESLLSLPTLSIVLDPDDLFGPADGLYSNPFPRGIDSERPASIEYILPDDSEGFQIDAGLRMMGWTSRVPFVTPKHSLRIVFRDRYGAGRLNYPFFDGIDVDSFDTIALRANNRDTWLSDYPFGDDARHPFGGMRAAASYIRDQWSREVQRDMGRPTVAGNFVHLYLNGLYWGVYNPTERPDSAFASEHFGGTEDDFDAVTFCNPTTRATDGDLRKWNELIFRTDLGLESRAAYQRIQGNHPDGTRNPAYDVLIDVDNFIDYIVAGQFAAADDWPCNFYALRERGPDSEGFQFVTWDNDLALPTIVRSNGTVLPDIRANRVDIDIDPNGPNAVFASSPWRIELALRENPEYLVRYADAVQRHLFNGGALTPEANVERWTRVAASIAPGLVAESARWGDYRRDVDFAGEAELYTIDHWHAFNDQVLENYFPDRGGVFLNQLRRRGLFPDVDAPSFNQHGGDVTSAFQAQMTAAEGLIWYTLDGSDPRMAGGGISPDALPYSSGIAFDFTSTVKARVFSDGDWSALVEATFEVDPLLRVSEIMYNPSGNDEAEYVELQNTGTAPLDLAGVRLVRDAQNRGIEYEFLATDVNHVLQPGAFIVIAKDRDAFRAVYPNVSETLIADRGFSGSLSNSGETLTLLDRGGGTIQQFAFDNRWHPQSDNAGRSLVVIDAANGLELWSQQVGWRASFENGGSPGHADLVAGDVNQDNVVDENDIVAFLANNGLATGATRAHGDLNGDGVVDRTDLVVILQNFGRNPLAEAGGDARIFTMLTVGAFSNPHEQMSSAATAELRDTDGAADWNNEDAVDLALAKLHLGRPGQPIHDRR